MIKMSITHGQRLILDKHRQHRKASSDIRNNRLPWLLFVECSSVTNLKVEENGVGENAAVIDDDEHIQLFRSILSFCADLD